MDHSPSQYRPDVNLEKQLLKQMLAAESAYRAAAADYQKVRSEYGLMLDYPDGILAVRRSARKEHGALTKYSRALRTYADAVLHRKRAADQSQSA
jgi:hypothetical protein